ncbi:MAG: DNA polymerase I, partial [Deltaproteobacteria bacterium]|nr:DNA polymerase I [Deltaproteobacteria bacterium]
MPANPKAVYLMDASAFIHRAYHAMRNFATKSGVPTGAVLGFTNSVIKLLKDRRPEFLAVVYDSRHEKRRHELYPAYKANRPPMDLDLAEQQAPIREIVSRLGLCAIEKEGFEADDVIAAMCKLAQEEGREVVIVSGDKDFYQLLSPSVSMYDPDPKKKSALNLEGFRERFGLEPRAFLEMQGLMGDASDNIPGIPGIGEVTAKKLIAEFGTIENLYLNLGKVSSNSVRDKLRGREEEAKLSRRLALLGEGLEAPAKIEDLAVGEPDLPELKKILAKLEFSRLLGEIEQTARTRAFLTGGGLKPSAAPPPPEPPLTQAEKDARLQAIIDGHFEAEDEEQAPAPAAGQIVDYDAYVLVSGEEAWKRLLEALRKSEKIAVDLETDGTKPSQAAIVGLSLATGPEGEAFYIPVAHEAPEAPNQSWELVRERLAPFLTGESPLKVGQHAKFDWQILARYDLALPPPSDDPMLASYLLNPDNRHGLDSLSLRELGHQAMSYKSVVPDPKKTFASVEVELACKYSSEDADLTLRLAKRLRGKLGGELELEKLYDEVELPLEELLGRMEGAGVLVDPSVLEALSLDLGELMTERAAKIYAMIGHELNLASPKQLSDALFVEMKLPPGKKTAKGGGFSTDNEVLSDLAPLFPVASEIIAWRELSKLKTTYADKLPEAINPLTGRVHTSYNQALTATGRLSSSDPNLQNIPARSEEGRRVRAAFIAPEGYRLISADYSQIELRVMAHFSGDEAMRQAFLDDEDIHAQTASQIFGIPLAQVPPERRREAKTINFGIIYGQGPYGLAKQLGIPQSRAKEIISGYFHRFPGVLQYMEKTRLKAERTGLVRTWFG